MDTHSIIALLLALSSCLSSNVALDEIEGRFEAELDIIDLELIDDCEGMAEAEKLVVTDDNYDDKIRTDKAHGSLLKFDADTMKGFSAVPFDDLRAWTLLKTSGDHLLPEDDYENLVVFANKNEQARRNAKLPCLNGILGCTYTEEGYQNILQNTKNYTILKESWLRWQTLFESKKDTFSSVLHLVNKAAEANGKDDAQTYWEMLVDQEEAYAKAEEMWKEIQPLYEKLHNFVKQRLFKFYNLKNSTDIPLFLLGSNFGHDWSYIADMILPHPQLHYDADSFLKRQDMKYVYDMAGVTLNDLGLGPITWQIYFDRLLCEPVAINYCYSEKTELYTCNTPSWVSYLDAYEAAVKIKLDSQSYKSYPRQKLRYSVLDEALAGLGTVFAIDATVVDGVFRTYTSEELNSETLKMSKLLLTALRILPRLPYYLAADKWRLEELKTKSSNINLNWWKFRRDIQNVEGVTNMEADYLGDSYINSNKPYLSKFLGIILQFQLLEYYRNSMLVPEGNVALEMGKDENFKRLLESRAKQDWKESINYYYGIYDLTSSALFQYFQPLDNYLGGAPMKQKKITTTTTLSTTSTTTTMKPVAKVAAPMKKLNATKVSENLKTHPVQNEEPAVGKIKETTSGSSNKTETLATYIGGGLLACVCISLLGVVLYRRYRKRRRPQNNRRFET